MCKSGGNCGGRAASARSPACQPARRLACTLTRSRQPTCLAPRPPTFLPQRSPACLPTHSLTARYGSECDSQGHEYTHTHPNTCTYSQLRASTHTHSHTHTPTLTPPQRPPTHSLTSRHAANCCTQYLLKTGCAKAAAIVEAGHPLLARPLTSQPPATSQPASLLAS